VRRRAERNGKIGWLSHSLESEVRNKQKAGRSRRESIEKGHQ
jgi:hypothetical protein